jgi:hypothetical protein
MYQEVYGARVLLYDTVEYCTVYTNDGINGRVGQYYNTRAEVTLDPERNLWVRKSNPRYVGNAINPIQWNWW